MRAIVERNTRSNSLAYGRAASAASCARRNRAAETNFMARVICWVFFTERMRRRKSRSVAMSRRYEALAPAVAAIVAVKRSLKASTAVLILALIPSSRAFFVAMSFRMLP
jgi:hypothetical protein